jgi:hypothetical protein
MSKLTLILGLIFSFVTAFPVVAIEKIQFQVKSFTEEKPSQDDLFGNRYKYKIAYDTPTYNHQTQVSSHSLDKKNTTVEEAIEELYGSSKLYKVFQKRKLNVASTNFDVDAEYDLNLALSLAIAKFKINEEKTKRDPTIGFYLVLPTNF